MDQHETEDGDLSCFDALAIAVQVERNGIDFYRKAATLFSGNSVGTLFDTLQHWERTHVAIFSKMRDDMAKASGKTQACRPDGSSLPPQQLLAGLAVFGVHPNPAEEFMGHETSDDILRAAVQKEKDAIVFYTGLKDLVRDPDGRSAIDDILREEVQHVRILSQALKRA